MTFSNQQLIWGGVAAVALLWYLKNRAVTTAKDIGQAVNPTNPDNVFYEGVNSVGGALTGDGDFSLGAWIYEQIHEEAE